MEGAAATRQIDGTDVIEQGTLAAENVLEALKDVIDPELGINIVDLGLVYGVVIGSENQVRLDMTLTSAACPLTDVIERPGPDDPVRRDRRGPDQLGVDAAVGS